MSIKETLRENGAKVYGWQVYALAFHKPAVLNVRKATMLVFDFDPDDVGEDVVFMDVGQAQHIANNMSKAYPNHIWCLIPLDEYGRRRPDWLFLVKDSLRYRHINGFSFTIDKIEQHPSTWEQRRRWAESRSQEQVEVDRALAEAMAMQDV